MTNPSVVLVDGDDPTLIAEAVSEVVDDLLGAGPRRRATSMSEYPMFLDLAQQNDTPERPYGR